MSGFIDIHAHILPGVDDGASSVEESAAMLRIAEEEGIRKIILTPHQKPERRCVSVGGIHSRIQKLNEELQKLQIDIRLYPGSELFFRQDLKQLLRAGAVCTLADSRYVLIEFLPGESWEYIRDGLYGLVCAGYFPVVAHVERYENLMKDLKRIRELIDMGCYMQINAGSLSGDWGFGMKRATAKLVREHLVHFVGTDAHRQTGKRTPRMEKCAAWLKRKAGREYAEQLLWRNAEAVLADREIQEPDTGYM